MPKKIWMLTNVDQGIHHGDFRITPNNLPGAKGNWKVTQRVLHGGLSEGVDLIEIDNGQMRLMVIPTRGMGIWRAMREDDQTLGWRSPVRGPVHPNFVPLTERSGLGWLEGFDELVVRCGLESNGEPEFDEQGHLLYPLHGRIANRPAYHVEVSVDDSAGTITLRGLVEETRFHFQKLRLSASVTTSFNSTSFTINDEVENYGGTPAEMQMLYHINLGEPMLGPGSRLVAPVRAVEPQDDAGTSNRETWDQYRPPQAGTPEECFSLDLESDSTGQTQVLLKNAEATSGTSVEFNTNCLPYFTLWKNMVASEDGYVTGLEPATNFPNKRSTEGQHGRVIPLTPGQKWSAQVVVNWLTDSKEVGSTEDAIRKIGSPTAEKS